MASDLVEKVAMTIHPLVNSHKDWPEWGECAEWYKNGKRKELEAAIAVVLREVAKRDICDTADEIARENGIEL